MFIGTTRFLRIWVSEIRALSDLLFQDFEMDFYKPTFLGKFEAIANEIQEYLQKSSFIIINLTEYIWLTLIKNQIQTDLSQLSLKRHYTKCFNNNLIHIEVLVPQMECRLLQTREVKKIVDHVVYHVCRIYWILDVQVHPLFEFVQLIAALEVMFAYYNAFIAGIALFWSALI